MNNKMEATVLANNSTDAQAALQLHQERKAEIDGRQNNFSALKDHGRRLVQQQHPSKDEIGTCLSELEELRRTLAATWEERKVLLSQCQQLCHFDELVDQVRIGLSFWSATTNLTAYSLFISIRLKLHWLSRRLSLITMIWETLWPASKCWCESTKPSRRRWWPKAHVSKSWKGSPPNYWPTSITTLVEFKNN